MAGACALADGGAAAALPLPLGPPGLPGALLLDPLGLAFLVPVAIAAAAAFALAEPEEAAALFTASGGALLMLVAGDAFLLAAGASLAVLATGDRRRAVLLFVLLAALAALAPHGGLLQGDAFNELRPARATGGAAGTALVFPAGVVAALLLLWPAGVAGPVRRPALATLCAGVWPSLGLFLLFRLLFDLGGAPAPVPAALLLLLAATSGALLAGLDAITALDLERVVAALGTVTGMLGAAAAGVALLARAADLPQVASAGAASSLLAAAAVATARPLASVVTLSVREQAGSVRLAALGGLVATMPRTAAGFLLAAGTLCALPPLVGFSAFWLAVESLLASAHGGAPGAPVLLAACLVAIGLAASLACGAALRTAAVVFGGRPRTPRGAAATETRAALQRIGIVLASLLAFVSLLPGAWLWLAAPFLRAIAGAPGAGAALALASPAGDAMFAPLLLALLLAVLGGAPLLLRRRLRLPPAREVATWDGGAAPPPDWLPFGEPLAQAGAAGFLRALPLPQPRLSPRWPTASARLTGRVATWLRRPLRGWGLGREDMRPGSATLLPALLAAAAVLLLLGGEAGWL